MHHCNVFILSGPSGSGKSTILKKLRIDEAIKLESIFKECNPHEFDSETILSKWKFIGDWFNRIVDFYGKGAKIIISDRSPLGTVGYAKNGELLLNPILQSFSELKKNLGYKINFVFINIVSSPEHLKERRDGRPKDYDGDVYHENDSLYQEKTRNFYMDNSFFWQFTIVNSDLDASINRVERIITTLNEFSI